MIAIWAYEGVVRKAILALKYKFAGDVSKEIVSLAASELVNEKFELGKYVLVPIPLHKKRENWRGFNQSFELGRGISVKMGWEVAGNVLSRVENTPPQARLKRQERLQNIRGKYAVNKDNLEVLNGKTVVLLDDVWTTGATMVEAGKTLRKAGIGNVWGMVVARS